MRRNDQFAVENRRNWKGEVFDYDAIQAYEQHECQYCLTDAQVAVLGGIIEQFGWVTRWQSETQDIDEAWVRDFKADIARRLMMACCNDDLIYRYDEDGNLEVSEDGGTTYTPSPQDDIRINPEVSFPPPPTVEGEDVKCIAADGAVTLLKEGIGDQLTDDMSRYTLNQLISDWTNNIMGTSGPFKALATIITNQIFALLISAIRAALTTDVYDTLRCILDCNMDDTAFFDGEAWEAVRSQVLSQISGIAGVFLEHLIYLLGNGGLTNLARAGAGNAGADCSECCPVCGQDWIPYASYGTSMTIGTDDVGPYIQGDGEFHGSAYYLIIHSPGDENDCCDLQQVRNGDGGASPAGVGVFYVACGVVDDGSHFTNFTVPVSCHAVQVQYSAPFTARVYFT